MGLEKIVLQYTLQEQGSRTSGLLWVWLVGGPAGGGWA